jgi:putative chitinase
LPHVVIPQNARPTVGVLLELQWSNPGVWSEVLTPVCAKHGIHTPERLAAFLANTGHETNGGRALVENLNYSVTALITTFGRHRISTEDASRYGRDGHRAADQRAIANTLYGGDWGKKNLGNTLPDDGWRFRGRGLIQLTGRRNYERFATIIGAKLDDAFLKSLEGPTGAAESAAHFWASVGCNDLADKNDITAVRKRVNGGDIGLGEVTARYKRALEVLA